MDHYLLAGTTGRHTGCTRTPTGLPYRPNG
jgi:hypothetical protein